MSVYSHHDYASNPSLAAEDIGALLKASALRLFLGAGVSSGFGLPDWISLLARILKKEHDSAFAPGKDISPDMIKLVDQLDDGTEDYPRLVHEALYRDVQPNLLDQLQRSPLLLAIAALMTGTNRGRIDSVITHNYDDLLEQYLGMLGLSVCRRCHPSDLSTRADVELNYVHGRLPQRWPPNNEVPTIVLSEKSYRTKRAQIDKGWSAMVEQGLHSKIGLFLGLSGNDSSILEIFLRAQENIQRNSENYHGYWVLTPRHFNLNKDAIESVGMCPIPVKTEDIPNFVFRICQAAAS